MLVQELVIPTIGTSLDLHDGRCSNGDRLVDFAVTKKFIVSSSRFQHSKCLPMSWNSSDGFTTPQKYYLITPLSKPDGPLAYLIITHTTVLKPVAKMEPITI